MVRVSGCSGPRTCSNTGTSAANWPRAAAWLPASPVQRARLLLTADAQTKHHQPELPVDRTLITRVAGGLDGAVRVATMLRGRNYRVRDLQSTSAKKSWSVR